MSIPVGFPASRHQSDGLTRTGDFVGTLRYIAPELLEGWSDRRGDLYSLGATLYELLTLWPFFLETPVRGQLVDKILHESPPPSKIDSLIPRDLETIVLKAIGKEPASRYHTADQMAEDLWLFWPTAQSWLAAQRQPSNSSAGVELLLGTLQSADPDAAKGADYTVRQLLDEIAAHLGNQLWAINFKTTPRRKPRFGPRSAAPIDVWVSSTNMPGMCMIYSEFPRRRAAFAKRCGFIAPAMLRRRP